MSDILAIAEGTYKPVCDVKEIMVLVREKLKKDSKPRMKELLMSPLKKPTPTSPAVKPARVAEVRPVKRKVVVKVKKKKTRVNGEATTNRAGPAPSMPIVSSPSPRAAHEDVVSAASGFLPQANNGPAVPGRVELTIDAVVEGMESVAAERMYCRGSLPNVNVTLHNDAPLLSDSVDMTAAIDLPFIAGNEDSNAVPTESLSPSLKVVDDIVTKDAMTILSEDINEASNSSDIGSVLIPGKSCS